MNCPNCNAANVYVGLVTVECTNPDCKHYKQMDSVENNFFIHFVDINGFEAKFEGYKPLLVGNILPGEHKDYKCTNLGKDIVYLAGFCIRDNLGKDLYWSTLSRFFVLPNNLITVYLNFTFYQDLINYYKPAGE